MSSILFLALSIEGNPTIAFSESPVMAAAYLPSFAPYIAE